MADEDSLKEVPYIQVLPGPTRRRIQALKKIQFECLNIEAAFFRDVHKLENQYHARFSELYNNRMTIVTGEYEPTDDECKLELPGLENEEDEEIIKDLRNKLNNTQLADKVTPGIPDFWLTIFKNVQLLNDMVQPHDEPILRHLYDIKLLVTEEPMGFMLKFFFSTNPFFTDSYLTKEYIMKCSPDESDPWSFEGPEIIECKGCEIDWHKNMNVTVKTIRKRQRHKSRGAVRTIVKTIQNDSFFNFFNPPTAPPDNAETDEVTQALLTSDFEIGHYIKEKIIPHAVLYYTGEALDDELESNSSSMCESNESDPFDDDDDEEEDDDDDDEDDEGDDDDLEEVVESVGNKGGNKKSESRKKNSQPQDCAQQ